MSSNLTISTKVMKRISATRKSETSEYACINELVFDLREGYSKNTRDEEDAKHLRIQRKANKQHLIAVTLCYLFVP